MTQRLIETWLPMAALGEESVRERRSLSALPPVYYLHVWWARRPLIASRAAILASLLPADADRGKFLQVLGTHGDPVAARKAIDQAVRAGAESPTVLDPTAGGGSIPLESVRLGLRTWANDLNPVAGLILRAIWRAQLQERLATVFPPSPIKDGVDLTYLWARTIVCP